MSSPVIAGRYRLESLIGRGASAEVYRATDLRSNTPVAIKLLLPVSPTVSAGGPSLAREIEAAQRLNHPGIVRVLDTGASADHIWLAMQLAMGAPLTRYVQATRLLPEALVLRLGAAMAQALAHAHSRGVVHRDLKPSNVLVDVTTAQIRLLDFGVARIEDRQITRTGMTLGTPLYMSPEQLAGAPATAASDVYALGVLLFEMFTGRRPHEGSTLGALLRSMAGASAAVLASHRPDLPAAVCDAVQSCLAREPAARPADLLRLAKNLEALATGLTEVSGR